MGDCDEDEFGDLPKDFSEFWEVVLQCRTGREEYTKMRKKLGDLSYPAAFGDFFKRLKNDKTTDKKQQLEDKADLFGLREKCEAVNAGFQEKCRAIFKRMRGGAVGDAADAKCYKLSTAPIKGEVRTMYKFVYKYSCDASKLSDIVRASFVFKDASSLWAAVKTIGGEFYFDGGILRIKDRLSAGIGNGYSDVLLNVRFQGIVCEIQLPLNPFYDIKNGTTNGEGKTIMPGQHAAYAKARHFDAKRFNAICYPKNITK